MSVEGEMLLITHARARTHSHTHYPLTMDFKNDTYENMKWAGGTQKNLYMFYCFIFCCFITCTMRKLYLKLEIQEQSTIKRPYSINGLNNDISWRCS